MDYYIDIKRKQRNTAGAKAPADIISICESCGMTRFEMKPFPADRNSIFRKLWLLFAMPKDWRRLMRTLKDGDRVIYQHPAFGYRIINKMVPHIKSRKNCTFVALIHDLESLRKGIKGVVADRKIYTFADNEVLKKFDYVICHNGHMKEYLVKQGFNADKVIPLEIFDYICDEELKENAGNKEQSIAIAGNLAKGKSEYIYKLAACTDIGINLYGINYNDPIDKENVSYKGSFAPGELPQIIEGQYGLVWDGTEIETCAGNTGEYLRYNNPHKTSLYLAAGMPVIVWKNAAIADFILANKVGIAVENLQNIERVLSGISDEEYGQMKANAQKISKLLREGNYFKTAVSKCR